MKKIFSIILYIVASLIIILGVYLTGLYLITNFLIGPTNMGQVLDTMDSLPLLPLGSYSLIFSGLLYTLYRGDNYFCY